MANGTPLGGPTTGLEGPLAQMWRSVSRNIADAAEARLAARLEEHVYQAHGRRALTIVLEGAPAGGGGTTDVTVTTDASLTATESPANTFALAVRLSPDAGNALALRANGLFATDTTGGGGGTGNTTMYTQTTAPTGAANSLWFNPSETA